MNTASDNRDLAFTLIELIAQVLNVAATLPASCDEYAESLFVAAGNLCEVLSAICSEIALAEEAEDPHFDFGPEPLSHQEATAQIGGFVLSLKALVDATKSTHAAFPFSSVSVRSQTFACHLINLDK
jgi:hypothetical protein